MIINEAGSDLPRFRMNYKNFLNQESGNYGVDIPKNVKHTIQGIDPSMLFECKEWLFMRHEEEGILTLR